MQYQSFLIKYAEIGTKGKNRYIFEDALMHQIREHLKKEMCIRDSCKSLSYRSALFKCLGIKLRMQ